jgi:hypothetical protein
MVRDTSKGFSPQRSCLVCHFIPKLFVGGTRCSHELDGSGRSCRSGCIEMNAITDVKETIGSINYSVGLHWMEHVGRKLGTG